MKLFRFYKTGLAALLIFLSSPSPVLGNKFYDSLPDPKREEIKIIDDHTVEVGIGIDNRSVSCNILDVVQSIPYVGAGGEPDTVFINKEKVYHFRKGLYTWDREGKYRVRLTTKYIREFGSIRIHVPEKGATLPEEQKTFVKNPSSTYLQNLSQNIKEEITIIDEHMVEVAIGPGDHSVSATILHAVKSIPSVKEGMEPEHVFVNGEPVNHIKEGVYAWDLEGKKPVRLTAKYIREFGNIQIYIADEEPPLAPKEELEPVRHKEPTVLPEAELLPPAKLSEKSEPELAVKEIPIEKSKSILVPEPIVTQPVVKAKPFVPSGPSSLPVAKKINAAVKGFRLAQFGMGEERVIRAIQADFGQPENKIEKREDPESGQRILTIASPTLDIENGKAWIHYYLSSRGRTLNRVDVIWGHPDYSKVDPAILQKSAERFKNLFHQMVTPTATTGADTGPYIFYGIDMLGNGVKLMWDQPYNKDFQSMSNSEPTLVLSYFQPFQ